MDDVFERAAAKPIFAIVTTHNSRCRKLNQTFYEYAQKMQDTLDVTYTFIDCAARSFCSKYAVRHLPQFVLIRNAIPKYWKYTSEIDPYGWNNFLRYELSPPADNTPMWNEEDIRNQLYRGASYFHCEIAENDQELFKKYMDISTKNRMFGTAFTYQFVSRKNSTLHFIFSNECNQTMENIKSNELEPFINTRLFSAYHHYDSKELKETESVYLILASNRKLSEKATALDKVIRANKCSQRYKYGIASLTGDRWIGYMAHRNDILEQALLGLNFHSDCSTSTTLTEDGDIADQTFYQTLEGQIKCEKIKRIDQSWPSMDFTLFVGTFLLFAVVSAVLFLFHAQINFLRQFFF